MLKINRQHCSPNSNGRGGASIDTVILHYTDMDDCTAALERLCDPASEVSSHYVISREGEVFQLVDEGRRAWHAGVAHWQGSDRINDRSIGIELDYPGHRAGLPSYPEAQIEALLLLLEDIQSRHVIPADRVLGHEDVAPDRKRDPGPMFPWSRLQARGLAIRPEGGRKDDGRV